MQVKNAEYAHRGSPDNTHLRWYSNRPVPLDFRGPTDIAFEPFQAEWAAQPGIGRFIAAADRDPDHVAIDDGRSRITYGEARRAVEALAGQLEAQAPRGRPIPALLRSDWSFPVAFLACLATGRAIIPIDADLPAEHQAVILAQSGAEACILGHGVATPGESSFKPIRMQATGGESAGLPQVSLGIGDLAGITYTSGSTGRPKGVVFSQREFLSAMAEYINSCHLNASDRILSLASLSGAGIRDALGALLTGATLHIVDLRRSGMAEALRVLADARITILGFVPSVMRGICSAPGAQQALASLRVLSLFGEAATPDDIALFRRVLPAGCHIRLSLASTEAQEVFHWFVPPDFEAHGPTMPVGYLATGKAFALEHADGDDADAGELIVRSRSMAVGVWRDGQLLPGPVRRDPADPEMRILRTGDVVRVTDDGLASFVERRDRQIKIMGLRADLAEIEAALRLQPGVADCAVVAVDKAGEPALVAWVASTASDRDDLPARLKQALAAELPAHMVPGDIRIVDAIPRLPNYKPDLMGLARDAALTGSPVQAAAPVAEAVRRAWAEVFGEPSLAADEPFDLAGGDSLRVLRVILAAEQALGIRIPLTILTRDMRAGDLSTAIERLAAAQAPAPPAAVEAQAAPRPIPPPRAPAPPVADLPRVLADIFQSAVAAAAAARGPAAEMLLSYGYFSHAAWLAEGADDALTAFSRRLLTGEMLRAAVAGPLPASAPAAVAIAPGVGAKRTVVLFGGVGGQFWEMRNPIFVEDPSLSLVFLREFADPGFHLYGVHGLAADYGGCVATLRRLSEILNGGADGEVVCVGNSSGGYAALRYALDLQARDAVAFSGATTLDMGGLPFAPEGHDLQVLEGLARRGRHMMQDLAQLYATAAERPDVTLCYPRDNPKEAWSATRMGELPRVRLVPVPDFAEHDAAAELTARGEFDPLIRNVLARGMTDRADP